METIDQRLDRMIEVAEELNHQMWSCKRPQIVELSPP